MTSDDEFANLRRDVTRLQHELAVLKQCLVAGNEDFAANMRQSHDELMRRFEQIAQQWLIDLRTQLDQMAGRLGMSAEPGSGGKIGRAN